MKKIHSLLLALCMPLFAMAVAGDMRGFASVANYDGDGGIVTLSPTSNRMTLKYAYSEFGELGWATGGYAAGGAVYAGNNQYIVFTNINNGAVTLNISDGKIVAGSNTTVDYTPTASTYDYASSMVYGCFNNSGNYFIGKFDPTKRPYTVTKIADCSRYVAMAAALDGTIYAIDGNANVVQIEKESGNAMQIGSTGQRVIAGSLNCAAIDWNTGKMYWQTTGDETEGIMYTINTSNGSASRLYTYPEWHALHGFDFEYTYTAATQLPPSTPTIQSITFSGANKSGSLTFKAPTTMVDGNKGSGALSYKVMIDGTVVNTGNTAFGATLSTNVSVSASGSHKFAVTVSNDAGESNAAEQTRWVGYDKPQPVTNIEGHYADGKITLTWSAPTAGVNGAYFNAADLTYKVYRGNTLVATVGTTTATDNIGVPQTPTPYIYNVYAVQGDETSDAAQSSQIYAGALTVPYRQNFDVDGAYDNDNMPQIADFNLIVINDGDPDYTWRWRDNAAQCPTYGRVKADDWLITPPIHLEAGKEYRFRMDALCGGTGANAHELFSVSYGREATVEAMTNEIIATTDVSNNAYQPYGTDFTVAATGDYCFGIHCTSEIHYHLQIDNIVVRLADDYGVPSAVTGLTVTPDFNGALKATIEFNIPTVDAYGDPIAGVDRVRILRDQALIYTSESGYDAGAKVTYTDELLQAGYHTYTVATTNAKGSSSFEEQTRYIGVNKPAAVTGITAVENEADWGEVTLTWVEPTKDVDGYDINKEFVSYDIFNTNGFMVAQNIRGNKHTFRAIEAGKTQQYVGFRIVAHTQGGDAEPAAVGMLPLGAPFDFPYAESFANREISSTFAVSNSQGAGGFSLLDDSGTTVSFTSQDGDNGFMCFEGTPSFDANNLDIITLHSGKVYVGNGSPSLSFYFKGNGLGSTNYINVYAHNYQGTQRTQLNSQPITTNISNQWERIQFSLDSYKSQIIIFEIEICNVADRFTYIDNIRVEDAVAHDLAVANFAVPTKARAGESMTAQVRVQNRGGQEADDWSVVLKRDGEVVWTQPGITLASGTMAIVYLYDVPPVTGSEEASYTAAVVYDLDEDMSNNETEAKTVELVMPEWPAVEQIVGEMQGTDYVITWSRPNGQTDYALTDSFEDYMAWEKETIGDWKVYDGDGLNTAGWTTFEIPVAGTPAAFYVFEGVARTGNNSICAFSSTRGQTEDWLISPVLNGERQTVRFYEQGLSTFYYPDTYFQIMYSTTDNNPWSFVELSGKVQASGVWTEREFTLPDGAKYFAIVATADQISGGPLFIDDITYTPATHSTNDLEKFRIYRDNQPFAEVDAETLTFTDHDVASDAGHRYFVTVVYSKGESVPSQTVGFDVDGIYEVTNSNITSNTYDLSGRRVTRSMRGVTIREGSLRIWK